MGLLRKGFVDYVTLFFAITMLFGIAIFSLIIYNAYNDKIKEPLNNALTSSTPVDANANVTEILDSASSGLSKLDPLFPLLMIGIFAYVIIIALMAKSHPTFFFIGLIVLGVALIIAAVFSNVYGGIASSSNYSSTNGEFNIIALILNNLPLVVFILFIAISVVLYALRQGPPQGGAY